MTAYPDEVQAAPWAPPIDLSLLPASEPKLARRRWRWQGFPSYTGRAVHHDSHEVEVAQRRRERTAEQRVVALKLSAPPEAVRAEAWGAAGRTRSHSTRPERKRHRERGCWHHASWNRVIAATVTRLPTDGMEMVLRENLLLLLYQAANCCQPARTVLWRSSEDMMTCQMTCVAKCRPGASRTSATCAVVVRGGAFSGRI